MDHTYYGRPPTRRRALADTSSRANEDTRSHRRGHKHNHDRTHSPSPQPLPHNESLIPNGTLAVRHRAQTSPENKRLSAVIDHEPRRHDIKRDSQISNTSTGSNSRRRKTHIGPWQLGRTIGRGGCSRVRLVRHSGTGQYGAAKIISKATAEKVRAMSLANLIKSAETDPSLYPGGKVIPFGLEREICIMKLLDHQNIVRLYDIWENRDELYLIMEFVEGGELFSYIGEQGRLPEVHVVHIFRQIIAALLYCHRINIHHRDLKPENILLDRDNMQIKLVDFGMAALQPSGKKLTTPCGSPHYAAPEVIKTTSYDGAKADVWSCGVILYVLLTGSPPFNYSGDDRDLKYLFHAIAHADYIMPDGLSKEAQDLIRRILVPEPKRRISLEMIWNHPFLRKYSDELNFVGANATIDHWIGPLASISEWKTLDRADIDREILRYLRTLWHSEKEEVLIQRLVNKDANQEKYFYSALQKYHDDQLENYVPSTHHAVAYSNSDHHHNGQSSPTYQDIESLPTKSSHARSQSGFSILNNEHLYSKHSFYEPPPSDASYDPFRASKDPLIPSPDVHQNITIHRGPSSGSRKPRPVTALGHRTKSTLRVQALRNTKRSSVISRESSKYSSPSQRSASVKRLSISKSSLTSSHWPSSPPLVVRPGGLGRRGVSFSHLRDRCSSVATESTNEIYGTQYTPDSQRRSHELGEQYSKSIRANSMQSSVGRPLPRVHGSAIPRLRISKPESPTKYIQSEARKVSTELEKVMEEAFNRSSVGSSVRTSATEPSKSFAEYDTPPTSFSNRDSGGSAAATPNTSANYHNRPLPPVPKETPTTFLQRKLAETRAEIARRLMEDNGNTEHFSEVLDHLDRLMVPGLSLGKRVSSAPAKSPERPAPLHVIPEEVKADGDDRPKARRAVTDNTTIRLVDKPAPRIAPLNVNKRISGASSTWSTNDRSLVPATRSTANHSVRPYQDVKDNLLAVRRSEGIPPPVPEKKEATVKKKKSWFRRTLEDKDYEQENQKKQSAGPLQIPEAWHDLDDRIKPEPHTDTGLSGTYHAPKNSVASSGSEFPMRNNGATTAKSESTARKGFFGLFSKKFKEEKGKRPMEFGLPNFSCSSVVSDGGTENDIDNSPNTAAPEIQMNWLSRFLHIKPATETLCFQVGRGKVRQDLVRLLRDWQRFGVYDVTFDRHTNVINAHIHKHNQLRIKPVSFVIELFVVLENGRRAKLCLARFTQTRGAASSFRKVVEAVGDVCQARNMLVDDERKKGAMMEVLG